MDLTLSEDQKQLLESARGLLERRCGFAARRKRVEDGLTFDRDLWAAFAEMGWLAIMIPEDRGGLGLSVVEAALVAEEFGRAPVLEPFAACAVLPAAILSRCAGSQADAMLAGVADGSQVMAVAVSEPQSRGDLAQTRAVATAKGAGWRLHGRKTLVPGAGAADTVIVVARTSGAAPDRHGLSVFAIPVGTRGLRIEPASLVDWSGSGDVVLDDVAAGAGDLLGQVDAGWDIVQAGLDEAIVVLCAELVGAMECAIELTAAYVKERKQYGAAIGSFQVVQHRLADMAMDLVLARSAVYGALQAACGPDPERRSREASGCKALVSQLAHRTCAQGIQLHGGYGITEEYQVGQLFKRVLVVDALYGRRSFHLARYAAAGIG